MDKKAEKREYDRRYRERNREKIAEHQREYGQTENGKKHLRINNWKRHGIIADNWEEVHAWFMEVDTCDICDCVFTRDRYNTSSSKCLDHDHSIKDDYNIRGVICNTCNVSENSESENRYVYPNGKGHRFQKRTNGKLFSKTFLFLYYHHMQPTFLHL